MPERQHPYKNRRPYRRGSSTSSPPERTGKPALPDATELIGQLNQSLTDLAEELKAGKSDRLEQYLSFAALFHHYSRGNQWLIEAQMPTATRIASYAKWQEWGYQVAAGAKGIRILAPSKKKGQLDQPKEEDQQAADQQEQKEPTAQQAKEPPKAIMRFVAVSVFDVSQLTPEKRPPEFFTPLEGDSDALQQRLVEAATSDGFNVQESEYTRGAEGYSSGRNIVTRSDLTSVNRTLTTIHEYAHALLHQGTHPLADRIGGRRDLSKVATWVKECHAEATAYVVAKHFGLPTPFSADYLLHWGTTPDALRMELDVVLAAAGHIISKLEGDQIEQGSEDPLLQSES